MMPRAPGCWAWGRMCSAASQSARPSRGARPGWWRLTDTTSSPEQPPGAARPGLQPVADHQVDLAQGQLGTVVGLARQRMISPCVSGAWRWMSATRRGQEQRVEVVAGGDAEGAACWCVGRSAGPVNRVLGRAQMLAAGSTMRPGLGGHHVAMTHQQRVARESRRRRRRRHRRLVHCPGAAPRETLRFGQHGVHAIRCRSMRSNSGLIASMPAGAVNGVF